MKKINAFSLIEMLIVLGILVVFIAAGASIFTKKFVDPSKVPHGQYECYYDEDDGKVYEVRVSGNKIGERVEVPSGICTFTPPVKKPAYYMVALVGGGASGARTTTTSGGGGAGEFKTMFYPSIVDSIQIKPGPGGAIQATLEQIGNNGQASVFDYGGENPLSAAGGTGNAIEAAPVGETPTDPGDVNKYECASDGLIGVGYNDNFCSETAISSPTYIVNTDPIITTLRSLNLLKYTPTVTNDYYGGAMNACYAKASGLILPEYADIENIYNYDKSKYTITDGTQLWLYPDTSATLADDAVWYSTIYNNTGVTRSGSYPNFLCVRYRLVHTDTSTCSGTVINNNTLCVDSVNTLVSSSASNIARWTLYKKGISANPNLSNSNDVWAAGAVGCNRKGMRLPTRSELALMYANYTSGNSLGMLSNVYWSSEEVSATQAYMVAFNSGGSVVSTSKAGSGYTRCVKDYVAAVTVEDPDTSVGDISDFDEYIQVGDYHWRSDALLRGNGGAGGNPSHVGYGGAVVVIW